MFYNKITFGDLKSFNVVVEVPSGGKKKYEYDPKLDAMKLEKVLYGDAAFPYNYGHVVKTVAQDESPLDAFVLSTYPICAGTIVGCRPVGLLEVVDRNKADHKILAIPISETHLDNIQDLGDIAEEDLKKFRKFYEQLPAAWDQDIKLLGMKDKQAAIKEILRTLEFGI